MSKKFTKLRNTNEVSKSHMKHNGTYDKYKKLRDSQYLQDSFFYDAHYGEEYSEYGLAYDISMSEF